MNIGFRTAVKIGFGVKFGMELYKVTSYTVDVFAKTVRNKCLNELKTKYADDETVQHFVNKMEKTAEPKEEVKDTVIMGFTAN